MERSESPVKSYQDLIAWRKGISLVLEVYKATTDFPQHEIYGLSSQLRRAATSIPSNIPRATDEQPRESSFSFYAIRVVHCVKSKHKSSLLASWVTSLPNKRMS